MTDVTLTSEQVAVLASLAASGRRALGIDRKTDAEHAADDALWELGWFVPSRVSPDERGKP